MRDGLAITEGVRPATLSARDVLNSQVVGILRGQATAHVTIDIGGAVVTAAIPVEAVDELALMVGDRAAAIAKASDMIKGKRRAGESEAAAIASRPAAGPSVETAAARPPQDEDAA